MRPGILLLLLFLPFIGFAQEGDGEGEARQAAYYELSPSIVVNVKGRARYMRCDVQLMTRDQSHLQDIVLHAPALRHELLLLFSDQQGDVIKSSKGKEQLRRKALKALQGIMTQFVEAESIDDLFFTTYFVE
ncbi:MAG: flagellar basal body-associated FliL family protein [Sedimenticola sp.]|nr:flagellar basal body-associated FliL family protein [Sedimenticola sp.]